MWVLAVLLVLALTGQPAQAAISVNYSRPVINATYVASVEFDMRAMGPLYNNSHLIIDAIVSKQAYPEGFVVVSDGNIELVGSWREQWKPLVAHYGGAAALTTVALVLALVLPLVGLFWCCCRACRRKPRRPFDRKYDACWKAILALLLIALLTAFLFGIVCLFATETQAEGGLASSGAAIRAGATDAATFLETASKHARHVLVNNFNELEFELRGRLKAAGTVVSLRLGEVAHGSSVSSLHALATQLDDAVASIRRVRVLTERLRAHAERLNAALRRVKAQLLNTLAQCDQPQCKRLQDKHKIGQLDTEIHYSQMPDMSELLAKLEAVIGSGGSVAADVEAGQRAYSRLKEEVKLAVEDHLPPLYHEIESIGRRLARVSDEISWLSGNASESLVGISGEAADTIDTVHAQWGLYRMWLGRGVAGALTLTIALLAGGLACGVCGQRPDHYTRHDCCTKGHGARALLCGVMLMFIFGSLTALTIAVYFLTGSAAQRLVCDPLTEPRDNRLFADLERFVDLEHWAYNERADPDFNMTYVMLRCHSNRTVYEALQLRRLYDVEKLGEELSTSVRGRALSVRPTYRPRAVRILPDEAKLRLRQLLDSGLADFDFDKILYAIRAEVLTKTQTLQALLEDEPEIRPLCTDDICPNDDIDRSKSNREGYEVAGTFNMTQQYELETNMTSLSLTVLSEQLSTAAAKLQTQPGFKSVAADLNDAANKLHAAHRDILLPMLDDTTELNSTAVQLRDGLRLNHSSPRAALTYLLREAELAEGVLATNAPRIIQNMTAEYAEKIAVLIEEYMERVKTAAYKEVGVCGPLSHAFNATRDAHCRAVLMPLNGYWIALCWCIVLLGPVMAVSVRLARLYRSLDPYPGPLVEAEYLYDAYADRDNVPLANAYKAEKRSGREARRAGAAASGAGPAGSAAAPPAADAVQSRRYNDMAPKHWEEGPPRYHGPTEYERPPPYYYPGPHDRQ